MIIKVNRSTVRRTEIVVIVNYYYLKNPNANKKLIIIGTYIHYLFFKMLSIKIIQGDFPNTEQIKSQLFVNLIQTLL